MLVRDTVVFLMINLSILMIDFQHTTVSLVL